VSSQEPLFPRFDDLADRDGDIRVARASLVHHS
jgi:hypothetical protein